MKQPDYREGPEALENSKRLATVILQAPAKKQKKQNYFIVGVRIGKILSRG